MPRLRRSDCSSPGLSRRRRGRGFQYFDPQGAPVTDPVAIERIRRLAIPPAWRDVWICADEWGHLQAVGTDVAGRKQYVYHQRWRERRDQQKFDRMIEFARALPGIRTAAAEHLEEKGLTRNRVLACAVRLLDRGFFRIGGEDYAEQAGTYGLATMHKRHVRLEGDVIVFDYPAKGGKKRVQSIVDPEVQDVVAELKRRRAGGPELLAYRSGRRWRDLRSVDINEYVKEAAGGEFTAKDFRTWHATVLAAVALAVSGEALKSKTGRTRAMSRAVNEAAAYLGNTPAVCRASYIDPRVFDRYRAGVTIAGALDRLGDPGADALATPTLHGPVEEAVLDLLEGNEESPAIERVA
jgi:DNA topoisomerase I